MEEAGFQKVPEDDSTTASSFLSMGTPLGQTRLKCGSVLVSACVLTSTDMTQSSISKVDLKQTLLCIFFLPFLLHWLFYFLLCFLSLMVQVDSSLLFCYSELSYSFLVFAVPCILSL